MMMRMIKRGLRLTSLIELKIKVVMIEIVMKVVVRSNAPIIPTQTRVITNILDINTSDTLVLNNQTTITQTTILLQMILSMPLGHTHYHTGCPHQRASLHTILRYICSYYSLFNFDTSLVNISADKKNIVSNTLHVVIPQDIASSFHNRITPHNAEDIAAVPNKNFILVIQLLILLLLLFILINN